MSRLTGTLLGFDKRLKGGGLGGADEGRIQGAGQRQRLRDPRLSRRDSLPFTQFDPTVIGRSERQQCPRGGRLEGKLGGQVAK